MPEPTLGKEDGKQRKGGGGGGGKQSESEPSCCKHVLVLNLLLSETRGGRNLVWRRGEGQKKLETGFPCGMSVLNTPPPHPLLVK